ncbi:MAG: thiamine phosphate synthase, partial [Chloroflexota bacterium]
MNKDAMLQQLVSTGIYLVTEDAGPSERRLQAVSDALAGGARVVQLRDKHTPKRQLLEEARAMKALCHERDAVFIVNDDVALAWASDADGVHVGQDDLPVEDARKLLGEGKLIGLSISTLEQAIEAVRLGADYIGVGAIYPTLTKPDKTARGVELLKSVRAEVEKPLVAIGGIDETNAAEVFAAGADSIAVV